MADEPSSNGLEALIRKRQKGERIVVWVTGISGSGRNAYVELQQQLARANGKDFGVLDVSDFFWVAFDTRNQRVHRPNILDLRANELQDKAKTAYDRISAELEKYPERDFVVTGHATFHWDNNTILGYHPSFFRGFEPDLFVNIIENEVDIVKTLNENPRYAPQWARQKMNDEKAIQWLTDEFTHTKLWADHFGKPWCVIPRFMAPTTLFMAMYYPAAPWIYYAQQMTHALEGESYSKADEIFNELIKHGPVFNPKGYEIYHFDEEHIYTSKFTDTRDTEWWIPPADVVVAFYHDQGDYNQKVEALIGAALKRVPTDARADVQKVLQDLQEHAMRKGATPSEGVADETCEAFNLGKFVYRIWPPNKKTGEIYCSPFVLANSTRLFPDRESFFSHFRTAHGKPADITIPEKIMDDAYSITQGRREDWIPENFHA